MDIPDEIITRLSYVLDNYHLLALKSPELTEHLTDILAKLYKYYKSHEIKSLSKLKELIVSNLSIEQIWQQLNVQNNLVMERAEYLFQSLKNDKKIKLYDIILPSTESKEISEEYHELDDSLDNVDMTNEEGIESDMDEDVDIDYDEGQEINSSGSDDQEMNQEITTNNISDVLDQDEFGYKVRDDLVTNEEKLDEFEEFFSKKFGYDDEENEDESSESEDINYFSHTDVSKNLMYKDFFDPIEKPNENLKGTFDTIDSRPSKFQEKQEELVKKISEIEVNFIKPKTWEYTGEVISKNRPVNSLLDSELDFNTVNKNIPIITEETTKSLEELIISRVVDEAYDDVVRKQPKIEIEKKEILPNNEKSKVGLGEIYEKEYMESIGKWDPNEDTKKLEEEATKLYYKIEYILNNLTNSYFTTKPFFSKHDKDNINSIQMEEITPIYVNNNDTKAPEELLPKLEKELKSKSELTKEDRKKERKKLKEKKHKRLQLREIEKKKKNINKPENVLKLKEDGNVAHSSNRLFKQLQDEVNTIKDNINVDGESKKSRKINNGSKYKL